MLVREMLVIYAAALCSVISPDFWTLVFNNFPRTNVRLVDWSIGLCTMAGSAVLNYSALVSIWDVSNASSCASLRVLFVCTVVASAWVWYTVGWEVIRMFCDLDSSISWI